MDCLHISTCGRCRGKDGRSSLLPPSLYEQERPLGFPWGLVPCGWIPGHTAVTSSVPSSSESKHKVRPGSTSMPSIVTQLFCFSTRTCLMIRWHLCLPVSLTQAPEGPLLAPESQLLCVDESSLLPVFICRVDMCCR